MTSLPRALPLGELARQRLRGQARQNKTRKHSDTMSLTNGACIAVFFAFCQHPCPLRHGFAVPPLPKGEALAFRDVFQQTQIGFIENVTFLPRALPLGELARQRLRGQARQNKTRKHSDTMSLTNRACIAVFFVFCQHPCPLRHGFAVPPCPLLALSCHLPRPGESFKVRGFGIPQRFRESRKRMKFQKLPPTQPVQSYLFIRPASVLHGLADTNL